MSRLSQRIAALERQAGQQARQRRCSTCRDWPSRHLLITEIDADGNVTRCDKLEEPSTCPSCGWAATIHKVDVVEVKNWERVRRHGLD